MIYIVIWTVLMMFWLFFGCYTSWDPARPAVLGNTLIPWLCVLIIGLVLFGALPTGGGVMVR
jgi:hypothetical protein